jgi:hypothetical protein
LAYALLDEFVINGRITSMLSLAFGALALLFCVIYGQKASLVLRSIVSIFILYWAFGACLEGRTTGPGLTGATFGIALMSFLLYGSWPGLALLRLWPAPYGRTLFIVLFPLAFLLAASTAGTEEYFFVRKYRDTGVGPTPRWTVHNHWLAYDKENHRLDGSD